MAGSCRRRRGRGVAGAPRERRRTGRHGTLAPAGFGPPRRIRSDPVRAGAAASRSRARHDRATPRPPPPLAGSGDDRRCHRHRRGLGGGRVLWSPQPALARELADVGMSAHAVYSREVRHAVEVGVDDEAHLVSWLSNRLDTPIEPPDLSARGLTLLGGRLVPDEGRPAAQLMYKDRERPALFAPHRPDRRAGDDGDGLCVGSRHLRFLLGRRHRRLRLRRAGEPLPRRGTLAGGVGAARGQHSPASRAPSPAIVNVFRACRAAPVVTRRFSPVGCAPTEGFHVAYCRCWPRVSCSCWQPSAPPTPLRPRRRMRPAPR